MELVDWVLIFCVPVGGTPTMEKQFMLGAVLFYFLF